MRQGHLAHVPRLGARMTDDRHTHPTTMNPDEVRHASLLSVKLRVLVQGRWDLSSDAREGSFAGGASLAEEGGRAWLLVDVDPQHRLGHGLALAVRANATELHIIVDDDAAGAVLARRAAAFGASLPISVWKAVERELVPVAAAPVVPESVLAPEAELYRPLLIAAGLDPVVESGVLTGELLGIEVARVVVDETGSALVEAGVGRFDREAAAMMYAELNETETLARAVDIVGQYRVAGAGRHPLNQLVPERWLRATIVAHPSLVGAVDLQTVSSALPRRNLNEDAVASALGVDAHGRTVLAACSTGVNLDLVPSAIDDRLTHHPDARLLLVVPERDAMPITRELAALVEPPAEVITVPSDWRTILGGSD